MIKYQESEIFKGRGDVSNRKTEERKVCLY